MLSLSGRGKTPAADRHLCCDRNGIRPMVTLILSALFTVLLAGLVWVVLKILEASKRRKGPEGR